MRLRHLNLRVRDPAACTDFYASHFGFEPAFEAEGGVFLRDADGFLLAVVPAQHHTPLPDGFHIGFASGSPDAVMDFRQRLSEKGVRVSEILDSRPAEEYVTFRCWDPDGTEIEVFWETA